MFKYGIYHLKYFSNEHFHAMFSMIILALILLLIPYIFKGIEKGRYITFLGILMILVKIADSLYRLIFEKAYFYDILPLHLCNISIILAGIYFLTRKRIIFNMVYFYFSGAILALLFPELGTYHYPIYPYSFMLTHVLEIFAVLFAFIHLDERVTFKGFIAGVLGYITLVILAFIVNGIYGTNYMYVSNYILAALSFIKPLIVYQVLFITLFLMSIVLMYLPFAFNQKDELEEKEI